MSEVLGITFKTSNGLVKQMRNIESMIHITRTFEGTLGARFSDEEGLVQIESVIVFPSLESAVKWLETA